MNNITISEYWKKLLWRLSSRNSIQDWVFLSFIGPKKMFGIFPGYRNGRLGLNEKNIIYSNVLRPTGKNTCGILSSTIPQDKSKQSIILSA